MRITISEVIGQMDKHLRMEILKKDGNVQEEKLWENTFIKQQIDRRQNGESFSLDDHIRAMAYAMLSSGISWDRVAKDVHPDTKRIVSIDEVFCNYDINKLLKRTPEQLRDGIKMLHCATQSTFKQMEALLFVNIPKLQKIEKRYGSIDTYYQKFTEIDKTLKTLIVHLSTVGSVDKMEQMNIALVCEYLRNIGHDLPKPDRHICRILSKDYLALSDKKYVEPFEAFDIVVKLAKETGKSAAETDYILWAYCAKGFGGICTKKDSQCGECVAEKYCKYDKKSMNGRD